MVAASAQKWMDFLPPHLLFNWPRSSALVALKMGWPLWLNIFTMSAATLSHSPAGLTVSVAFHFLFWTRPEKWPTSLVETLCVFKYHCWISQTSEFVLLVSPNDVVEHRHKYHSFRDIFWFTIQFSHPLLDFSEDLELYWFPIESIQFFVLLCSLKPRHSGFPFGAWLRVLMSFSHTQYWVEEYINFCLHELPGATSPTSSQSSLTLTLPRSPNLVRGSVFETLSVQLVFDLNFVWRADSRSNSSMKNRCMHGWSHEYSPNKRILVTFFHLFAWRAKQYSSQPLIHFFFEWDWAGRKNIAFFFRLQATTSIPTFHSRYRATSTSCRIFSSLARFPCHGRPRCCLRSAVLVHLLRVRHSVALNETLFLY